MGCVSRVQRAEGQFRDIFDEFRVNLGFQIQGDRAQASPSSAAIFDCNRLGIAIAAIIKMIATTIKMLG